MCEQQHYHSSPPESVPQPTLSKAVMIVSIQHHFCSNPYLHCHRREQKNMKTIGVVLLLLFLLLLLVLHAVFWHS